MGFYSEENCQTEAHEPLLDWASGRKAPVPTVADMLMAHAAPTQNCHQSGKFLDQQLPPQERTIHCLGCS